MKRILIIHHGEGVGGGLVALLGLIEELKANHVVEVLCIFESSAVPYIKKSGVKVHLCKQHFYKKNYRLFLHSEASYFNLPDCIRNAKNLVSYFLSKFIFAKRELRNIDCNYEIVYLNSTFVSDWSKAANSLKKQVIIHIREPLAAGVFGFRRGLIRSSIRKYCDKVISISVDNAKRIGIDEKNTIVYDPVILRNVIVTQTDDHLDNKFNYFVYVGGAQRIKGFEQLVKCLDYLKNDIRIFFLGNVTELPESRLRRVILFILDPYVWRQQFLIKKLKSSDKIIFVGLVDDVFSYYKNSIAVISPFSKPHASLPILEAYSVGKPVIVSDIAGMDEIVNASTGFFFKNNRPKLLANTINDVARISTQLQNEYAVNALKKYNEIRSREETVTFVIQRM